MKVLMFGWEFPPYKGGGLATACFDLTKGLSKLGVDITFVMPHADENTQGEFVKLLGTKELSKSIKIKKIDSILTPYASCDEYNTTYKKVRIKGTKGDSIYGKDLFEEVYRFSQVASLIAEQEEHDVIHVHDWMTYHAGINARKISGKPLIAHIHATENDRTGGNPNPHIAKREYEGLLMADKIIANSNYTKQNVMTLYGIDPNKIEVVHWGIDDENSIYSQKYESPLKNDKMVLFMGRVTVQKGPDYFVEVANKVLQYEKNVKFVIAGEGDMLLRLINRVSELGISDKVLFTGWLSGEDIHNAYKMADIFVMPSVSEPFGLVALESLKNKTPVIVSKQSGVSEILINALKVDFWDIDEMTNKIVSLLRHDPLYEELRDNSYMEVQKFNLIDSAKKCLNVYDNILGVNR